MRAESMAAAAKKGNPHGMLSVIGLNDNDLEDICKQVGLRARAGITRSG